ncbi:MAG: four helix bundle protein [Patescibacteria group bacterium]
MERLGIGQKIENLFLSILELTFSSTYLPLEPKIFMLGKTISRLDVLKFFIQIAWENKLISTEQHIALSNYLEEIGRQLGGWKKGLETKLPSK